MRSLPNVDLIEVVRKMVVTRGWGGRRNGKMERDESMGTK